MVCPVGGGIEHDKSVLALVHGPRERAKDGDFFGAGRTQVFFQKRLALGIELGPGRVQDLRRVSGRFRFRVDARDVQGWQRTVDGGGDMCRRIGGRKVN